MLMDYTVAQQYQYPVGMTAVPLMDPNWDYQPDQPGILCLIEGMKQCIIKPVDYNKVKVITQGQDENPAPFQARLVEALRKYRNVDPKTFEGDTVFATHFISQSAPDIRQKLQKLAMGPQTPLNLLIDTAFSVFNHRDQAEEERKEQCDFRKERQQVRLLAAIMTRPNPPPGYPKSTPRRPPPGRGACFSCGSPEHWSKECPGNSPSLHPNAMPALQEDGLLEEGRPPAPKGVRKFPHASHGGG